MSTTNTRLEQLEHELSAYLDRTIEAAMGMRSWLGPMLDAGGHITSSASAAADPSSLALAAARSARHVEEALARIGPDHARVLAAYYAPRGPWAPYGLTGMGAIGCVALYLEEKARRTELAAKTLPARPRDGQRLRGLALRLTEAQGAERARLRRELARSRAEAQQVYDRALAAYVVAYEARRAERRAERLERFRRTVEGR